MQKDSHLVDLVSDNHPDDLSTCGPRPGKRIELVDPRHERLERLARRNVVHCDRKTSKVSVQALGIARLAERDR